MNIGKIKTWVILAGLGLVLPNNAAETETSTQSKPNIIFILADDLGYGDIGVLWQNQRAGDKKMKTPFFDQMAKDGMILNRHYCPAPVCAPSRGSLLTGLHQGHANVRNNQFDKALEDNHNLANTLQKAGYYTAIIGKYGLQGKVKGKIKSPETWPAYPTKRGFDYFFGYVEHKAGHTHYPNHLTTRHKANLYDQDQNIAADLSKCFTPDLFTARAKKLIIDEVNDGDQQPFFLYLAYDTPHAALQLPTVSYPGWNPEKPHDDSGLGVKGGVQWLGQTGKMINTAVGEIDSYRHPDYTTKVQNTWSDLEERQAGLVRRMDDNIGDLRKTLKDLGIEKNTLIIFSSDNGPHSVSYYKQNQTKDNVPYKTTSFQGYGPFEGIKRDCWEGGIREPSFAVWPGKITAGKRSDQISQFHDWLPTFCEVAGIIHPARTDGTSLLPTLTGEGKQKQTTTYVEYQGNNKTPNYSDFKNHKNSTRGQSQVIFLDSYKGIRTNSKNASSDFEIYDVSKDLKEAKNLTKTSPYFKKLNQRMKDKVLQIRMPDPSAKRPWDNGLIPPVSNDIELKEGLSVKAYQGSWNWIPEFRELTPKSETFVVDLNSPQVSALASEGGILCEGFIKIPSSGKWTFTMESEARTLLRIHEKMVFDNDFNHTSEATSVSLLLKKGIHPIRLYLTPSKDNNSSISLEWKSENSLKNEATSFYRKNSK